jgi:biopolymer transport protein ExbB
VNVVAQLKDIFLTLQAAWVLWLMLGLFVVALGIIIERALFFRAVRGDVGTLAGSLDRQLRAADLTGALASLKASRSAAAAVVAEGLSHADLGPEAAEKSMAGARALQRMRLERGLAFLGTLGNNAPFVGLLGTVIGIIGAFEALGAPVEGMAGAGAGAPTAVMGAIAEALVATAVGLLVAIPAVAAYNFFQRLLQSTLADTEALSNVLLAHLLATTPATPAARATTRD